MTAWEDLQRLLMTKFGSKEADDVLDLVLKVVAETYTTEVYVTADPNPLRIMRPDFYERVAALAAGRVKVAPIPTPFSDMMDKTRGKP